MSGASCLTWSADDTRNAKGIARGVKTREPWEILPKGLRSRSMQERESKIELAVQDILARSTTLLFHREHHFSQASILEAVVLSKFIIPP